MGGVRTDCYDVSAMQGANDEREGGRLSLRLTVGEPHISNELSGAKEKDELRDRRDILPQPLTSARESLCRLGAMVRKEARRGRYRYRYL